MTACATQPAGLGAVGERRETEALEPSMGFPARDLIEGSWAVQVLWAESVKSWMWTSAFSLMAYSAAMERMDLDTARMSS